MIFRCDDVLQTALFSPAQQEAFKDKSPFNWFMDAAPLMENKSIKLAVVAGGIEHNRYWVDLINDHPQWQIVCHGLEHWIYKKLPPRVVVSSLIVAKWKLEITFNQTVTEFHLPKLQWHENLIGMTALAGMRLMNERISIDEIDNYPKATEVYFHYWNQRHLDLLKKL